jgi:DHA1 family tetracycline resistance protein-like MFS transporter
MIGAAFGIGFIIGPAIGGLLSTLGLRAPFVAAAILTLINWLYGYFVLPESLSLENRRKFNFKTANPLSSLLRLKRYPAIIGLIVAFFLLYLAAQSVQSTWSYINIEKFKWNGTMVGLSLTMVGVMVAIVQGILIRKVIPVLGQQRAVFIGLVLYGVGQLLFGFATQGWMMFAFTIIYCLGGISGPALQGIISAHIPPNEQGELQGALTSLMSASAIIGPLMMTNLFAYFTKPGHPYLPGIPFLLGALLLVFSAIIAYGSMKKDAKLKEV